MRWIGAAIALFSPIALPRPDRPSHLSHSRSPHIPLKSDRLSHANRIAIASATCNPIAPPTPTDRVAPAKPIALHDRPSRLRVVRSHHDLCVEMKEKTLHKQPLVDQKVPWILTNAFHSSGVKLSLSAGL